MKWQVITAGKPALVWARQATQDYLTRLQRMASVEHVIHREGNAMENAARALDASAGAWRIVLDEKGKTFGSEDFSKWIQRQELASRKRVAVIIGGAGGHHESLKAQADETWSLSPMTLQHELALVVMLEQIYRAYSILRGEPYHRS